MFIVHRTVKENIVGTIGSILKTCWKLLEQTLLNERGGQFQKELVEYDQIVNELVQFVHRLRKWWLLLVHFGLIEKSMESMC